MRVCLVPATEDERVDESLDCSGIVGTPVNYHGETVGVVIDAWVDDGSVYADLDVRQDLAGRIRMVDGD